MPTALDALVGQTYKNLEIIVVNNGSSGDVDNIFEDYKELYPERIWKLIKLNENVGLFHARLKGGNIQQETSWQPLIAMIMFQLIFTIS